MKLDELCDKHGGTITNGDSWWSCNICNCEGINKCKCGGTARIFSEALMTCITCDNCTESLMTIEYYDTIKLWNEDKRGCIND